MRSRVDNTGASAFSDCTRLTSITIPDGVTMIKEGTFYSCTGLTSITIPESVFSIYSWAFYKCDNLTIKGKTGSYAQTYARENDIPFVGTEVEIRNTSSVSAQTITKGDSVTVNCAAEGGSGNPEYAVFYKQKTQTKWTCAQSYKTNKTVKITPKAATTYNIRVKVKDASGKIVNRDFTLTATK